MVQHVVDVSPQLNADALSDGERLVDPEIDAVHRRTVQSIAGSNASLRVQIGSHAGQLKRISIPLKPFWNTSARIAIDQRTDRDSVEIANCIKGARRNVARKDWIAVIAHIKRCEACARFPEQIRRSLPAPDGGVYQL